MTTLFFVSVTIIVFSILAASFTERRPTNDTLQNDSLSAVAEEISPQTAYETIQAEFPQHSIPTENVSPEEEVTVGERVQEVLKAQGIPFEIDEDGDVCFEYHFREYLLNKSKSTNGFFLDLAFREEFDEESRMMYIQAANCLHTMYRLVKMTIYENDVVFSVDSFVSSNTDYKRLLHLSLNLLEDAFNELGKMVSGQKEEHSRPVSAIGFHEDQKQMQQEKKEEETEKKQSEETARPQSQPPSIGFNSTIYKSNKG